MRATVYVWILLRIWLHHHKNCAIAASWICYLICRAIAYYHYYLYHVNNAIFYQVFLFIEFTLNVEDIIPNCRTLPDEIVL